MSIDPSILDKVRMLPPEKQQEVVDFIEFLSRQRGTTVGKARLRGLCSDLGIQITERDIDEARHEAWGRFPREDM
jgi:hypothetical protein